MKNKIIKTASAVFVAVSALSILSVSYMALVNPREVMDLVQVSLPNNDALSSIRGVYGGAGIAFLAAIVLLMRKRMADVLLFLGIFWGMYAICRLITIYADGSLGSFGSQWLVIETVFAALAFSLLFLTRMQSAPGKMRHSRTAGLTA